MGNIEIKHLPEWWQELDSMVGKLRRNREAVPIKVLKTKYASAYNALKMQIYLQGRKCVLWDALEGKVFLSKKDADAAIERAGAMIVGNATIDSAIVTALIRDMNIEMFYSMVEDISRSLYYDVYMSYWLSTMRRLPNGDVYTPLMADARWDVSTRRWLTNDGFVRSACPPEQGAVQKERDTVLAIICERKERQMNEIRSRMPAVCAAG